MRFDIILTTYDTVAGDTAGKWKGSVKEFGALETHEWHRLVLDEGKQCEHT